MLFQSLYKGEAKGETAIDAYELSYTGTGNAG